jgi:hypothetical protein
MGNGKLTVKKKKLQSLTEEADWGLTWWGGIGPGLGSVACPTEANGCSSVTHWAYSRAD